MHKVAIGMAMIATAPASNSACIIVDENGQNRNFSQYKK
jgi:hypothetical protein